MVQKDIVLTFEQSKTLKDIGFNIKESVYCWTEANIDNKKENILNVNNSMTKVLMDSIYLDIIPTLTLEEILNILPETINCYSYKFNKDIDYDLIIKYGSIYYQYIDVDLDLNNGYYDTLNIFDKNDRLLDNAFDALCWCVEQKIIKVK